MIKSVFERFRKFQTNYFVEIFVKPRTKFSHSLKERKIGGKKRISCKRRRKMAAEKDQQIWLLNNRNKKCPPKKTKTFFVF